MKISDEIIDKLRCPVCHNHMKVDAERFVCTCGSEFPIVHGVPVLINEKLSLFSINDFFEGRDTFFQISKRSKMRTALRRLLPSISRNIGGMKNYKMFAESLVSRADQPSVLILGGSVLGIGTEVLLARPEIMVIETDVSFGPRTMIVCDAHDIPFEDESVDGIVLQAVLEHVVDPQRCVDEVYRVLKKDGIVYAETAFMQQVHGGAYDFTRFTYQGHRRLFRRFEEINGGVVCGPGMALAWSYQYFLMSFVKSDLMRRLMAAFAMLTSFWLKYFDSYLVRQPRAYDAASACFFMGNKGNSTLSDKELVGQYRREE